MKEIEGYDNAGNQSEVIKQPKRFEFEQPLPDLSMQHKDEDISLRVTNLEQRKDHSVEFLPEDEQKAFEEKMDKFLMGNQLPAALLADDAASK